jgi:hypothetical protein
MTNSSTVVSATRVYGNVTLKLYMWWGWWLERIREAMYFRDWGFCS